MSTEQIIQTEYAQLMKKSYIDYAMSVIVARALPDVRDGLKPVQRRTLYDMHELGLASDRPYRKCARIVGDTMGKYHPHGDSSIYGALVVMAQDFKYAMPLVDGHGNFGSIEGDGAAAMRYTEARLQKFTQQVYLADLDKDVVDFIPNFDATEKEPAVLPTKLPNILINGAEGIAVGMATSIPPHNTGEVIDGMIAYIKDPDINTAQMLTYIKGPDFPTGGIVVNKSDLHALYSTGSGKLRIRGKVEIEKAKGGRQNLVITEIPYTMIGANIGKFLNDVSNLVETKKTTDIADISNQSSKDGIRIVLELKKGADAENLCNLLYKKTRLEDTFGVNMLAVAKGRPETLGLVPVIRHSVEFQFDLATRKYTTLLQKETEKAEIEEGLIKACDVIDLIIEILRGSRNLKQAKDCLINGNTKDIHFRVKAHEKDAKQLRFTERQADAILKMRLYKLIGLEIEAMIGQHEETLAKIERYKKLLGSRGEMAKDIIAELLRIKEEFAVPRRTELTDAEAAEYKEAEPVDTKIAFIMDRFGYAKSIDAATYERNREAADADYRYAIPCMSSDRILLFTEQGNMHQIKACDLPAGKFRDKGTPVDNLTNYDSTQEQILFACSLGQIRDKKLIFVTKNGMVKLVDGGEFDVSKKTTAATKCADGDELLFAGIFDEKKEKDATVVFRSAENYFLRIRVDEIPEKKKAAIGVRGMKLGDADRLAEVYLLAGDEAPVLTVRDKPLHLNRLSIRSRDTKGVKK